MYKRILILLMLIFLSACGNGEDILRYPENITYQDELVSWDEVSDATAYSIKINDLIYQVNSGLSFSVDFLPNGTYDVRLKTHKGDLSSYFSPALIVIIDRAYDTFTSFTLEGDIISWSSIPNALSYEIYDHEELLATTSSLSFDLSTLDLEINQLYRLHISAIFPSDDTINSNTLLYNTYENLDLLIHTTFNRQSATDLSITIGSQISIDYLLYNHQIIANTLYQINDDILTLDHDAFHPEELGIHTLTLLTPNGYIIVTVDVVDPLNPSLLSDDSIIYTPHVDMIFEYELNGGSFVGLSGNDITSSDYTFNDNELTIYASFIEEILQENPARETVILVYQLSKNSNILMGFIFINIIPTTGDNS